MDKNNRDNKKEDKKAPNKNPQHKPEKGSGVKTKNKKG